VNTTVIFLPNQMTVMIRTYTELLKLITFEDRYKYLKLVGRVGLQHFVGEERNLNQTFYHSDEWKSVRDRVVIRDECLDLGCRDYQIFGTPIVHHMNPITVHDLLDYNPEILDPEFLITTSTATHLAIHYGDEHLLPRLPSRRRPGDTKIW